MPPGARPAGTGERPCAALIHLKAKTFGHVAEGRLESDNYGVPIAELLAGAALDTVFGGVVGARRFAQANPRERMLSLLHREFGDRARLYAAEFDGWADDPKLIELIDGLISAKIQPDEETRRSLEREIAPHLVRTPESDERDALAADMADALLKGYVLAYRDFGDYGQAMVRKLDDLNERVATPGW